MSLKITSSAALVLLLGFSQFAQAAPSNRTLDQEIVHLTEHVDSAQKDRAISIKQALDIKLKEEDVVTKAETHRDENHGELRPKEANLLRSKLFMLDDKVSQISGKSSH